MNIVRKKRVRNNRLASSLQEEILNHIATTPNAGYDTLTHQIKKARSTIIQSLETLINGQYVNKQKIEADPVRNINTIFKATTKGILYSVAYLDASLDSIIMGNGKENEFVQYNKFIKNLVDKSQRNEFTKNTALALVTSDIFDDKGAMKISKAKFFFNCGLMSGLTEMARKSPEAELYFNKLSIDSLKKMLSPEELKEVQNYYSKVELYVSMFSTLILLLEKDSLRSDCLSQPIWMFY
jgi:hypothetical protein